jgi:hypothetical protein
VPDDVLDGVLDVPLDAASLAVSRFSRAPFGGFSCSVMTLLPRSRLQE